MVGTPANSADAGRRKILIAIWGVFGLLALLWTGGAWVAAELAQRVAQALASGTPADWSGQLANLPLPQWIAAWVDPALIRGLQSALLWLADAFRNAPLAGTVAGWLVVLVWTVWGLGFAILLLAAAAAHVLLPRYIWRLRGGSRARGWRP